MVSLTSNCFLSIETVEVCFRRIEEFVTLDGHDRLSWEDVIGAGQAYSLTESLPSLYKSSR